ncbi:hypothetical protein H310_06130 [Aphanomyces invadans]|uniref:Uncharacterized protein n=1 Tax=Aphanomyces invadans TaxID=157072 RepID=A0A024U8S3_9STRA|nr:hypothetical protein H310_06130 [Aphanomyces invadans]ETW02679.1 hypothetical protein H310_06130 [Aphanomyces invadans]|eukprot:XP_008869284.1 hypothetical protein H310_06130 [Aphanomyces invadans]
MDLIEAVIHPLIRSSLSFVDNDSRAFSSGRVQARIAEPDASLVTCFSSLCIHLRPAVTGTHLCELVRTCCIDMCLNLSSCVLSEKETNTRSRTLNSMPVRSLALPRR